MNCISGSEIRRGAGASASQRPGRQSLTILWLTVVAAAGGFVAPEPVAADSYRVIYLVRPDPATRYVDVTLDLRQSQALLRRVSTEPDARISAIQADGDLEKHDGQIHWRPPVDGGTMSWRVQVDHRRNGDGFDAWLGPEWGLFRAEDIIPRAATRTLRGAHSDTRLVFVLPAGWSVVTEYYGSDGRFRVANPLRRFDQPNGWILVGKIGVRRETIAGTRVAVAAPVGAGVRRMDTLALLNWTLPELARLLPEPPPRLTVVSAGEPMWRGGLSAPQSLFVHAERPLISENATSTLLHEIMHLSLGIKAEPNFDWIIEGLAEYYSLELLARSGTISQTRYAGATAGLAEWAKSASTLCGGSSTGATSALAVTVFRALDAELREVTGGDVSLDDVVRRLWRAESAVNIASLAQAVEQLSGHKSDVLHTDRLPGCPRIVAQTADSQGN